MIKKSTLRQELLYFLCQIRLLAKKTKWREGDFLVFQYDTLHQIDKRNSTCNIYVLETDRKKYYFRVCHRSFRSNGFFLSYLESTIDNDSVGFRNYVNKVFCKFKNRWLFLHMGQLNDKNSRIYKYYDTDNSSLIGLPDPIGLYTDYIRNFVTFSWSEVLGYRLNKGGGEWQLFGFNRAASEKIVAKYLGLDELICSVNLAQITLNSNVIWGSVMEEAKGVNPNDMNSSQLVNCVSPELLNVLTSLNILDVLCNEKDHRPGNYNILIDENGKGISIIAFDNDSPYSFFPSTNIHMRSYFGSSNILDKNGCINRCGIDCNLASRIVNIDIASLSHDLSPYLNEIQIYALKHRVLKLQQALRKSRELRLQKPSDWTMDDVNADLSGKYGRTYLYILKHWKDIYGEYSKQKAVFIDKL